MRFHFENTTMKTIALTFAVLLVCAALASAQQQVNLTVGPTTATLPDGQMIPMWGYSCGAAVTGSTATCAALNPKALTPAMVTPPAWQAGHTYSLNQQIVDSNWNVQMVSAVTTGLSGATAPTWATTVGATTTDVGVTWTLVSSLGNFLTANTSWSPVVITVPTAQSLQINLTNNLSFTPTGGGAANNIPTSLVIVGQLGGGLGDVTQRTTNPSPSHDNQATTWNIANVPGAVNTPPTQGPRVQSFSTEVPALAAGSTGTTNTASLIWTTPRPGTYLIESGTHPSIQGPMGLYGILVVTTAPVTTGTPAPGTAYPNVSYNAEIPFLLSEIDPNQNKAVSAAVISSGFRESATIGPYAKQPVAVIKVTSGGAGYQSAPTVTISGGGTGATAHAVVDTTAGSPTQGQVTSVILDTPGSGYASAPAVIFSGGGPGGGPPVTPAAAETALVRAPGQFCSGGATACYPPVVNYTPFYYLVNGVAFNKTNPPASLFATNPASGLTPGTGTVLVRLVNAGLKMHVPSIVGSQTTVTSPAGTATSGGFSLIAEDGNPLPGIPRVQSEVFMAAGKTYDVMINVPQPCIPPLGQTTCTTLALPIYDRELSLSGGAIARDTGMLAYIAADNTTSTPVSTPVAAVSALANPDSYSVIAGHTLTISDPAKGVIANDVNVFGVAVLTAPTNGTLTLNPNGTFTYVANATWSGDTFTYCGNGATSGAACALVTLNPCTSGSGCLEAASGITCNIPSPAYTSAVGPTTTLSASLSIKPPGLLAYCKDAAGYPLTISGATSSTPLPVTLSGAGTGHATIDQNGSFNATVSGSGGTYTLTFTPQNSQGTQGSPVNAQLSFPTPSGLAVTVLDPTNNLTITDYRWIIEEDRTFYVDPNCTTNPPGPGCPSVVPTFGVNFHTSYMPVVASGCIGPAGAIACETGQTLLGQPAVCDVGNGVCRTTANQQTPVDPSQVILDPTKRYYISVLPGDAANPFNTANKVGGHGLGGAPISPGQTSVKVLVEPNPFQTAKLSVFVFEDDFPLNGEHDAGGGVDVLATFEPGLGGFEITLMDDAGASGDATGQLTHDIFNMPLSNSLAGTIDPATGRDACPISTRITSNVTTGDSSQKGITGRIVTCPKYESDGTTLSPLAGQAVIANMMPGKYGVVATPAADRIARGEEWLQTNTLDGQKAHDSFLRIGEPSYFQEFGPAGYHVTIGFANPAIINGRLSGICNGTDPNLTAANCYNTLTGHVSTERMSRTPDQRLYGSGSYKSFFFTQCYVSVGDPDGEDFAFTKCDANGNFTLAGLPDGSWRVTIFDQWNDMLVDGLSTPVALNSGGSHTPPAINLGEIAINQWQANVYTNTFLDLHGTGVRTSDDPGLVLVPTVVRFRDGSFSNFLTTDLNGVANFNEEFPLFSWYVVETDSTRYKNTGTHVVYDAGGPADGTCTSATAKCGTSTIGDHLANTYEATPLPQNLHVPGAVYCAGADCSSESIATSPVGSHSPATNSTGRIDPPWVKAEGWQGFSGQNSFLEFGKTPYAVGENGGIKGHVVYASTRPFDDPIFLVQNQWEPLVPGVTINLYQEKTGADGSRTLTLVDTTKTSSWDDWAQGFRSDGNPNMSCPGQLPAPTQSAPGDMFFFSLQNQPDYLDAYNHQHNGTPLHTIPYNSQYKCYDGMHNWNQVQPAPYDGAYNFPSIIGRDPVTGAPTGAGSTNGVAGSQPGTNCTVCVANPTDGTPMLPTGKYVVEVVVPPGYELVKEEDKNILIGDNFLAPATQQFAGIGNVFILPDQAEIAGQYNSNNAQNATQNLGFKAIGNGVDFTHTQEQVWPCVGELRTIPDFLSLYPQSGLVSPFAGATRPLCDRKEVKLDDQAQAQAKFYIFTSTHVTAHFTGVITDDFTSEFDPFSPQFGEKFSPPDLPISIKDFAGNEISRIYADHWGAYNGLTYSTWDVNPPNPTGYAPQMMITCMNDPGSGTTPDPLYNPQYSQFCYEIPFMPATTQYMDTPVVPTSGFAGAGYNNPDCNYPDATPAIKEVDGDGIGPWVSKPGVTLTITALGDQQVTNSAYSGPSANAAPFNMKTVTRHFGFGSQCLSPTAGNATCNTLSSVTIGGKAATIDSWSDTQIQVTVPTGVPNCAVQQQAQYQGTVPAGQSSTALCGQLVITAGNGKQSVDTVTVTVGGKAPTYVSPNPKASGGSPFGPIQAAINAAAPGDLIMVQPGLYNEILLMWKPVRLQGVGAASTVINANTHPSGRMTAWRVAVNCLFGMAVNGQPWNTGPNQVPTPGGGGYLPTNLFDPSLQYSCPGTGWNYFVGLPNAPQIDRLPLEGTVGWDTTVNGNLAELLQEPSLLGAYEGAGITVLAKGVKYPPGVNVFGTGPDTSAGSFIPHEGQFPVPTVELTANDCGDSNSNPYPSNFQCNPSRIDGLSITNSSQGGGGINVHGWGHNLEIANNRIYNNTGTISGGIIIGQGEAPDALVSGNNGDPVGYNGGTLAGFDQQPWTCVSGAVVPANNPLGYDQVVSPPGYVNGQMLPFCYNLNVNVHNNSIIDNSSIGDELFSSTPAGAGGVTFAVGADYYKFTYNWVCGNLSTGDGGGFAQLGVSFTGEIEHNSILFNQSKNPTIPTNGGGLIVMGTPPDGSNNSGVECGSTIADADCAPGLSDGTGPGLLINANLVMGNSAESGSGGGIRLQHINGTEIAHFPDGTTYCPSPSNCIWNSVQLTNNIIVNNVAGWDGAGISLQDAIAASIVNNTIMSNDTTASSGVLFNTLGAPLSSSPWCPSGNTSSCVTTSTPQIAGVVSVPHSAPFIGGKPAGLKCAFSADRGSTTTCIGASDPLLYNDVIWQNRSFYIGVVGPGTGTLNQQNVVGLFDAFSGTSAPSQGATGACSSGVSYWEIGVRGDTGPSNHSSGYSLAPDFSVLTDAGDYGAHNLGSNPTVVSQYCNGSRVPPEAACTDANGHTIPCGYQVPPGISDATVPNPVFSLLPSATVDEGNNWINMSWGPLSLVNPTDTVLGNYALAAGSPAIDYVPLNSTTLPTNLPALAMDFFGNPRPDPANPNHFDVGAVEFQGNGAGTLSSISPNTGVQGTVVPVTITGTGLTLASAVNVSGTGITVSNFTAVNATTVTATFTVAPTATLGAINVTVTTPAGTSNAVTFRVTAPPVPTLTSIAPSSELRGTPLPVLLTGTNFVAGSNVVISPAATGVSVSGVAVTSPTTITATITSTSAAAIGSVNVGVANTGGGSNTLPFAITGPVLTSISPVSANRGTSGLPVTLTGSGLTGTTSVNVSGAGISVSGVTVVNDTTVTATLNIGAHATAGARNVTVTAPGGTSNAVTFTVTVPPIGLTSIAPTTGARGTTQAVTLTGISFQAAPATAILVSGGGITVGAFTVVNDTTITANFTIAPTAALTARNVTVTTATGATTPVTFTVVNPGTPILSSIAPALGLRRTAAAANPVAVTLTGSNFTAGSTVNVVAPANGLTVTGVTVVSPTQINATFNTTTAATIGPRSITVTTPGGTSGPLTYTVLGPVLTSIDPTSALRGQGAAIPVSIFGSGLTGATAVTVSGGGITVGPITVNSDTQITTTFTIAAGAAGTARNVTVTAPGGISNSVAFTVTIPSTPTLATINPATGVRGTTFPVTLTGTNFIPGETTVAVPGGGVTVSGVTVTSSTTATATFTITTVAALTARNVTVSVAGAAAASNTVPFTVQGATLTSIAPNSATHPATGTLAVPVTITGANLTGATGLTGLGGGVTLATGTFTVVNSTTITATLNVASTATIGIHNIGVTTPIGTTNTLPFTVN
jgi:hypothetical protein